MLVCYIGFIEEIVRNRMIMGEIVNNNNNGSENCSHASYGIGAGNGMKKNNSTQSKHVRT